MARRTQFKSLSDNRSQGFAKNAFGRKRIAFGVGIILLAICVIAWIDGGEEPLRPIVEEVPVPER